MLTAIVLMRVEIPEVQKAAEALADLPSISEVYSVAGEWDLVAIVRVREQDQLAEVVTREIAAIGGIRRTRTLIAFRAYSRHDLEQMFSIGFE